MIKLTCDKCGFNVTSDSSLFELATDNDPSCLLDTTLFDVCHAGGFTMVHVDKNNYLLCKDCYGTFKDVVIPRASAEREAIIDSWLKEKRSPDDFPRILGGKI
jgi:hypothetical protein